MVVVGVRGSVVVVVMTSSRYVMVMMMANGSVW